jgi:hypothetical protein
MALLMTVAMGFAALGFDLAYVRLAREEMQNATDAAAHAASITLRFKGDTDLAFQAAKDIAKANTVLGVPVLLSQSDVVFGNYDFNTKTFSAGASPTRAVQIVGSRLDNASGKVGLTFGRALGVAAANVQHSVTSTFTARYFQVEMQVADDYLCDIDNAADAAIQLLDYLNGPGGTPADWIGLDLFTGKTSQMTAMLNIRDNYALNIYPVWKPNNTTLGIKQKDGGGTTPLQSKGIAVCSKANAPSFPFPGPPALPAVPGGYRQCPGAAKAGMTFPSAEQFAYPNHPWINLNCSDGGPAGFFAGTDQGQAIKDGVAKLVAASPPATAPPEETRTLILVTNGVPMVCTGIGGGSLCGHTYDGDRVPPPPGKVGSDYWDPCCASALTCNWAKTTYKGVTYGGGGWGDGASGNSPRGNEACLAAQALLRKAIDEADIAASSAKKVDIFVVGAYDDPTSISAKFALGLARGRGIGKSSSTNDSTQLARLLKDIPSRVPVSLVK